MKKIFIFILAITFCLSLCSCDSAPKEPEVIKETDGLVLENLVVDDSYRDSDNSPRRAVYAFFTINANLKNIEFDSKYMDIIINETNTYTSEVLPGALCAFAPNYLYTGYIETAYIGESKNLVATFLIPEGDLVAGRQIKFNDSQIEGISNLCMFTDDIIHVNGDAEACKVADPEGYAETAKKYEEASPEMTEKVRTLINGRYWEGYVNPTWYRVEFASPNNFSVTTSLGTNSGTYSVRNGYIFCTYKSNGNTIKIPYEIKEQGVTMDLAETFRIS